MPKKLFQNIFEIEGSLLFYYIWDIDSVVYSLLGQYFKLEEINQVNPNELFLAKKEEDNDFSNNVPVPTPVQQPGLKLEPCQLKFIQRLLKRLAFRVKEIGSLYSDSKQEIELNWRFILYFLKDQSQLSMLKGNNIDIFLICMRYALLKQKANKSPNNNIIIQTNNASDNTGNIANGTNTICGNQKQGESFSCSSSQDANIIKPTVTETINKNQRIPEVSFEKIINDFSKVPSFNVTIEDTIKIVKEKEGKIEANDLQKFYNLYFLQHFKNPIAEFLKQKQIIQYEDSIEDLIPRKFNDFSPIIVKKNFSEMSMAMETLRQSNLASKNTQNFIGQPFQVSRFQSGSAINPRNGSANALKILQSQIDPQYQQNILDNKKLNNISPESPQTFPKQISPFSASISESFANQRNFKQESIQLKFQIKNPN